jgi:hypothetical protein
LCKLSVLIQLLNATVPLLSLVSMTTNNQVSNLQWYKEVTFSLMVNISETCESSLWKLVFHLTEYFYHMHICTSTL